MFWPCRFKPCDCFDSWDKNLGSGNTLLGENPTMALNPIRGTGRGRILQDASCLVSCYRNRVSSARVGHSLAHARLITPILELKRFVCSQTERLTHHQQQRKTKCEQVYVKMHYDYSSRVVSNALLIFETSIAWPLTWVNKSHASSCSFSTFNYLSLDPVWHVISP